MEVMTALLFRLCTHFRSRHLSIALKVSSHPRLADINRSECLIVFSVEVTCQLCAERHYIESNSAAAGCWPTENLSVYLLRRRDGPRCLTSVSARGAQSVLFPLPAGRSAEHSEEARSPAMVASNMRISDELKRLIEAQQGKLEREIHDHHMLYLKFQQDPTNAGLEKSLKDIQEVIQSIGIEQKLLIDRIRNELNEIKKKLQVNGIKNSHNERTTELNNVISRSRKQNIISRCASDDSLDVPSASTSPEPPFNPTRLEDLSQSQFLKYFGLVTHDIHDEMQKKRVERKRRSTANPQFFYGSRGWDYPKRKRGGYLMSNLSPPHTRQSAKNKAKAERPPTPPSKENSRATSPVDASKLPIPNLPVGLTIERVNPNRASPDSKLCVVCRLPGGALTVCESCMNGFHVSCHNRPLVQSPRKCPKCLTNKEVRTIGALTVPSGMSVSYVSTDVTEKLQEKQKLLDENRSLAAELSELQDRHSQLTISLKDQKTAQEELLVRQRSTEDKIKDILGFITSMKSPLCPPVPTS